MTDLKALRRDMAIWLDRDLASRKSMFIDPVDHIESALLRYAEACLGEPSELMEVIGYGEETPKEAWTAMAAQRMKELE